MATTISFEFTGTFKAFLVEYVDPASGNLMEVNFGPANVGEITINSSRKKYRFFIRVLGKNGSKFGIKFSPNVKTPSVPVARVIKKDNLYTTVQEIIV